MLNNGPEVEDIGPAGYLSSVWQWGKKLRGSARFTTWMFTILRNLVFNEIRPQKRQAHHFRGCH